MFSHVVIQYRFGFERSPFAEFDFGCFTGLQLDWDLKSRKHLPTPFASFGELGQDLDTAFHRRQLSEFETTIGSNIRLRVGLDMDASRWARVGRIEDSDSIF